MNSMPVSTALASAPAGATQGPAVALATEPAAAGAAAPQAFAPGAADYARVLEQTALPQGLWAEPGGHAKASTVQALLAKTEQAWADETDSALDANALPLLPSLAPAWQPEMLKPRHAQGAPVEAPAAADAALVTAAMGVQMPAVPAETAVLQRVQARAEAVAVTPAAVHATVDAGARSAVVSPEAAAVLPAALQLAQVPGGLSLELPAKAAAPTTAAAARTEQPVLQALAQRIQLQQSQGVEVATVRLDPPQLGTLEVRIQHDPSGVQVTLQASHAEVGRQLASLAEGLRQELQARTQGEASVVVAQGRLSGQTAGQGGQSRDNPAPWAQAEEEAIGQALQAWQSAAQAAG
ncbi:flagellar hook-length control protein FliK [Comamonas terrigena]|uniref:flagellar hook-length control protein FliK n=1 Tax=Comamonas terrigena TaxID=32013 RepID=UPI002448D02D|nr:flagellar hook-length control protein FliK [Comamonas terrigena]MDH1703644.1 flagellar hook-length control protein FliK [Comamonas terrigena]